MIKMPSGDGLYGFSYDEIFGKDLSFDSAEIKIQIKY